MPADRFKLMSPSEITEGFQRMEADDRATAVRITAAVQQLRATSRGFYWDSLLEQIAVWLDDRNLLADFLADIATLNKEEPRHDNPPGPAGP